MHRRLSLFFLIAFLTACAPATNAPMPGTLLSAAESGTTRPADANPSATPSATPTPLTPTVQSTSPPETLYGFPTPQTPVPLPTCDPTKDCFLPWKVDIERQELPFHELYVGKYVLRRWCDVNSPMIEPDCAITISSRGTTQLEVWSHPVFIGEETGADLTGRGKPDIVIIGFPGGNCCIHTTVYEAGDTLKKILDIGSEQPGKFIDLNSDGVDEFVFKTDRRFSQFCFVCTVWAPHVYAYRPGSGYVPATYKFKELLSNDIMLRMDSLSGFVRANPNIPLHFPDNNLLYTPTVEDQAFQQYEAQIANYDMAINDLYNLAVLYLLAGEPDKAQKLLSQYFPPEKATQYTMAIRQDVGNWLAP